MAQTFFVGVHAGPPLSHEPRIPHSGDTGFVKSLLLKGLGSSPFSLGNHIPR
ncbi:hypothetical protein [Fluoribacter gormanii]|uniref:hypothetical protein n=1 Tax=Fluoribacter gormanii TaxID=464 RepID=UPI000B07376D|nr:hypothetical protein [Fluoribacter gormanii]